MTRIGLEGFQIHSVDLIGPVRMEALEEDVKEIKKENGRARRGNNKLATLTGGQKNKPGRVEKVALSN